MIYWNKLQVYEWIPLGTRVTLTPIIATFISCEFYPNVFNHSTIVPFYCEQCVYLWPIACRKFRVASVPLVTNLYSLYRWVHIRDFSFSPPFTFLSISASSCSNFNNTHFVDDAFNNVGRTHKPMCLRLSRLSVAGHRLIFFFSNRLSCHWGNHRNAMIGNRPRRVLWQLHHVAEIAHFIIAAEYIISYIHTFTTAWRKMTA